MPDLQLLKELELLLRQRGDQSNDAADGPKQGHGHLRQL